MTEFVVKFDKLDVDDKKLKQELFAEAIFEGLSDVSARLTADAKRGLKADGTPLKGYSDSYIMPIDAGYVKAKGRAVKRSTRTNLTITGDLLRSRTVKKLVNGAVMFFRGKHYSGLSNEQLAKELMDKGFVGWHELTDKDVNKIGERLNKVLNNFIQKGVVIRKGAR